ncbi:SDR family oxidoreductase [Vibrio palustris]|uniref:Putative oxidoreductase SadH n=1 Tax=Vibrio palustris TaxID=1918946 RepID=A0A1R4B1G3_9VIBR|nr:SDR family oxidoreductase [Vibrio palustris]SJL82717.1 Putative oxidoreductase SadH [Vibrio palustris]
MTHSILITGCSTGIGYMAAHALKQRGYEVIASCRQSDDVARLQAEGLTCIKLDLAEPDSIDAGIQQALTLTAGRLNALFNNGAYGLAGALEDLPTQALREQFDTNFFGWHQLTTSLIPHFRQFKDARIVQNSSVLGFVAMSYRGAYNSSKFAIEGWTDTLRLELAETGIKVVLLEPGAIETQFRANSLQAFQRWVTPEKSVHYAAYQQQIDRLSRTQSKSAQALPAEACLPSLLEALESSNPQLRYRITRPTKIIAILKRLLPGKMIDKIVQKAS